MDIARATSSSPHTTGVVYLNGKKIRAMFDTGAIARGRRQIGASDRAFLFRAGPSLGNLVISTKADYGLSADDPRIVVMLNREGQFEVIYSRGDDDDQPEKCQCAEDAVLAALTPLLDRLWKETSLPED